MSPTPDTGRGWRELFVSLTFEHRHPDALVAGLALDLPDERLVEVELTGEQVARVLAGETVAVPGQVWALDRSVEEPVAEPDEPEPDEPELHEPEEVDDPAEPAEGGPVAYSTLFDQPPVGTQPITRSTDVSTGQPVVAYVRGRWRDAVVVRRDIGSLLVAYTREGSFGRVQQRVDAARVRRRT